MKKMTNREFINRSVYKSHIILMIISVLVGVISLTRCPSSIRHVQADVPQARLVINRVNQSPRGQMLEKNIDKSNDKNVRQNSKSEKRIKGDKSSKPNKKFWYSIGGLVLVGLVVATGFFSIGFFPAVAVDGSGSALMLMGALLSVFLFMILFGQMSSWKKKNPELFEPDADG